jgi:hypothetical protein
MSVPPGLTDARLGQERDSRQSHRPVSGEGWGLRRLVAGTQERMKRYPEYEKQLDLLRQFRTDTIDLQVLLQRVGTGAIVLDIYAQSVRQLIADGDGALAEIVAIQWQGSDDFRIDGDSLQHIRNLWEQMKICPLLAASDHSSIKAQDQLHYLHILDEQCRLLAFEVGAITIPERLNTWLEQARPGYYIPFHTVFEDEVPAFEDRVRLLNYLASSPNLIEGGQVDVASGLIYRYSKYPLHQAFTILLALAAFGGATWLVYVVPGLPALGIASELLVPWGALLTGVVMHMAVATAKRMQTQPALPPVVAIGDVPRVINAKIGQFLLKLLMALFGLFGLVFAGGAEKVTVLNAFLLGYSLDSVVELFAASIEQRAATQVASLSRLLR